MKRTSFAFAFLFLLLIIFNRAAFSQNVGINTSGAAPNPAAILDINASPDSNQGLLIPRMSNAQRQALPNPATGLLIYNTTSNMLDFYNGSGWQQIDTVSVSHNSGIGFANGLGIAINTTGNPPDNSALLDVSSTNKGILIPRIVPGSVAAVTGLVIYNTTTNALDFYNGGAWTTPCYTFLDNNTGIGAASEGVAINTTGASPDPSAILDISSSSKGLLIPRLTSVQRDVLPSPAQGLFIYNITDETIEYWTGTLWEELSSSISGVSASASPNPICTGTILSLTGAATGATSWNWTGPNGFTSNVQNPTVSNFSISDTGTYTLTASNACGVSVTVTTSAVSAKKSYVPITLTNNQATATPANFQQMITVNSSLYTVSEDNNLKNVEFSTGPGATGTILQAWIESGATNASAATVYWVNLGANTIAAGGGILTIYMNFMPSNIMSLAGPTGEAPQISAPYGQYDNGALVFPFYDNFKGVSFNPASNWVTSGITYTVNNGFTATATTVDGFIVSKNVAINPATDIVDFYGNIFINSGGLDWIAVGAVDGGETGGTTGYGFGDMIVGSYPVGAQANGWQRISLGGLTSTGAMQVVSAPAIWTITPLTATKSNFYINYGGVQTVSSNADTYPLYEGLIAAGAYNSNYTFANPVTISWYRVRLYPPADVMPTVTFGALSCP